jgi:hypothetical protein
MSRQDVNKRRGENSLLVECIHVHTREKTRSTKWDKKKGVKFSKLLF